MKKHLWLRFGGLFPTISPKRPSPPSSDSIKYRCYLRLELMLLTSMISRSKKMTRFKKRGGRIS